MHAFILHLTRARARRANAHHLLDTCGLPGEIWAAVDGETLDPGCLGSNVTTGLIEPPYPFPLTPGEIGCFLSHRQIWAEILRRDLDHALILEDDVTLDPALFQPALHLARQHIADLGLIQLQTRPIQSPVWPLAGHDPAMLYLPEVTPLRSQAQMISQATARRFLARTEQIDRPVDSFLQAHWATGLRAAVIHPSGVSPQRETAVQSTIHTSKRAWHTELRRSIKRWRYRRQVAHLSAQSASPGGPKP